MNIYCRKFFKDNTGRKKTSKHMYMIYWSDLWGVSFDFSVSWSLTFDVSFSLFRLRNIVYNTGTRWGLSPLYQFLGWDVGDMKCKDDLGMRAKRGCCASGCPCRPPVSGVRLQILYVVIKMFRVMIEYSIAARAGWNGFNDSGQTDDDNVFYCTYYMLPKLLSIYISL